MDDLSRSSYEPTFVLEPMVRQRVWLVPCVKSVLENVGQVVCFVRARDNDSAGVRG